MKTSKSKARTPKVRWHTVEVTSVIRLRIPHGPPKLSSGTRRAVEKQLLREGYSAAELAKMIADGMESFSWERG